MAYNVQFGIKVYEWENDKGLIFGMPNPLGSITEAKAKVLEVLGNTSEMFGGDISHGALEEVKPECWECGGKFECNRHTNKLIMYRLEGGLWDEDDNDETYQCGEFYIEIIENLR